MALKRKTASGTQVIAGTSANGTSGLAAADAVPTFLLDIPTYDGDPSITHLSAVHVPEKWNGHRYWLAFTPWPDAPRENPSIVVSDDLVNWEVPAGLTNPVVAAPGSGFNSDPHILIVDDVMWLYSRVHTSPGEQIWRRTSTDGVTWGNATMVLEDATSSGDLRSMMSPAVVEEANGTFSMWTCNRSGGTKTLERRTSADGLTWSAPSTCTLPTGGTGFTWSPSHIDVVRVGDVYHALLLDFTANSLHYLSSEDGGTWAGDPAQTFAFRSGSSSYAVDYHYRSSLIPKPGMPLKFDVLLSVVEDASQEWRAALYRDFDPNLGEPSFVDRQDGLRIAAQEMTPRNGSTVSIEANRWPSIRFPDTGLTQALASPRIPAHWRAFRVLAHVSVPTTNAGDIKMQATLSSITTGASLNADTSGGTTGNVVATLASGQDLLRTVDLGYVRFSANRQSDIVHLRVDRRPTDAEDTLTGNLALLDIELIPIA